MKKSKNGGSKWRVGLARVDITPKYSIRMSGYAWRTKPSEGIHDRLMAKAMAFDDKAGTRGILITTDLIGFDRKFADEIFAAIRLKTGVPREHMIINYSHTHSGPVMGRSKVNYSDILLDSERTAVKKYTDDLGRKIVALAVRALADLKPSRLAYQLFDGVTSQGGAGVVSFAMNRRRYTPKKVDNAPYPRGYVDRSVPVLKVTTPAGKLRCIVFGYSCHNTTIGTQLISADYAGYAQRYIEKRHKGVQAMFMQGCGADANPWPRETFPLAKRHGETLGAEVCRVMKTEFTPVHGRLKIAFDHVNLPLEPKPTEKKLQDMLHQESYYAKTVAKIRKLIASGKPWAKYYRTPLAVWQLGRDLTLVRISGEVVTDYIPLMEQTLGPLNLWVAGYCDDYFAYLPSARVHREGGYEGRDFISDYGFLAATAESALLKKARNLARRVGRPIPATK